MMSCIESDSYDSDCERAGLHLRCPVRRARRRSRMLLMRVTVLFAALSAVTGQAACTSTFSGDSKTAQCAKFCNVKSRAATAPLSVQDGSSTARIATALHLHRRRKSRRRWPARPAFLAIRSPSSALPSATSSLREPIALAVSAKRAPFARPAVPARRQRRQALRRQRRQRQRKLAHRLRAARRPQPPSRRAPSRQRPPSRRAQRSQPLPLPAPRRPLARSQTSQLRQNLVRRVSHPDPSHPAQQRWPREPARARPSSQRPIEQRRIRSMSARCYLRAVRPRR